MFTVLWNESDARRYTDLLSEEWFVGVGVLQNVVHDVRGPKGGVYQAKCDVTVRRESADLDYSRHAEFNWAHEMEPGALRVEFTDATSTEIVRVRWREDGDIAFLPVSSTIGREGGMVSLDVDDELAQFPEGQERTMMIVHRRRERRLRVKKIREAIRVSGAVQCEVEGCGFDFLGVYGEAGRGYGQVHHLNPLAEAEGTVITRLEDLAILCANCHAMVHRAGQSRSLDEIAAMLKAARLA